MRITIVSSLVLSLAVIGAWAPAAGAAPQPDCDLAYAEHRFGHPVEQVEYASLTGPDGLVAAFYNDDDLVAVEVVIAADNWVHIYEVTASGTRLSHSANPIDPLGIVYLETFGTPVEVTVEAGAAVDRICTGDGNDVVDASLASSEVEIRSGGGDDVIVGSNKNDLLLAGDGIDVVVGNDGDDVIDGGGAADKIDGGDGFDRCGSTWSSGLGAPLDSIQGCEKPLP